MWLPKDLFILFFANICVELTVDIFLFHPLSLEIDSEKKQDMPRN